MTKTPLNLELPHFEPPKGAVFAFALDGEDFQIPEAEQSLLGANLAPKRKRDFHLGREAARRALASLGYTQNFLIEQAEDGRAIWPEGFAGSISHSEGMAVSLISLEAKFVGVDLQKKKPFSVGLEERVSVSEERANLDLGPLEIFSAKEALFKALSPHIPKSASFKDAVVNKFGDRYEAQIVNDDFLKSGSFSKKLPLTIQSSEKYILTALVA